MTASPGSAFVPHHVRRALDAEDWRVDNLRPRKYCPVHRNQQMLPPMAPGLSDVCPIPHGGGSESQG
jgi:hypothetical protein